MSDPSTGHRHASSLARGAANGGAGPPAPSTLITRRRSYMGAPSDGGQPMHENGLVGTGPPRHGVPAPLHPPWAPAQPPSPPLADGTMPSAAGQPLLQFASRPTAAAPSGGELPPHLKRATAASPEAMPSSSTASRHANGKHDGVKRRARGKVGARSPSPDSRTHDSANHNHNHGGGLSSGAGGSSAAGVGDHSGNDRSHRAGGSPAVIVRVSRSYEHPFGTAGAASGASQRYMPPRLSPRWDAPVLATQPPALLPSITHTGGSSHARVAGPGLLPAGTMLSPDTHAQRSPPAPGHASAVSAASAASGGATQSPVGVGGMSESGVAGGPSTMPSPPTADACALAGGLAPPRSLPWTRPRPPPAPSAPILEEGKSAKERLLMARRLRQGNDAVMDASGSPSPPLVSNRAAGSLAPHPSDIDWAAPPSLRHRRSSYPSDDDLTRMSWDGDTLGAGSRSPGAATSMSVGMSSSVAMVDAEGDVADSLSGDAVDSFNSSATSDLMAMLEQRAPMHGAGGGDQSHRHVHSSATRSGPGHHGRGSGGGQPSSNNHDHPGDGLGVPGGMSTLEDSWAADRLWAPLCELSGPAAGQVPALDVPSLTQRSMDPDIFSSPGLPLPSSTPHGIPPPMADLPPGPVGIELSAALNGTVDLREELMPAPVVCPGDGPLWGGLHHRQVRNRDPVRRAVDLKRELKKKREGDEMGGGKGRGMSAVDAAIASLYVNFNGFGEWPARKVDLVKNTPAQECTAPTT
eukprot:jgi/Mesvir1/2438/Mv22168-RA.2